MIIWRKKTITFGWKKKEKKFSWKLALFDPSLYQIGEMCWHTTGSSQHNLFRQNPSKSAVKYIIYNYNCFISTLCNSILSCCSWPSWGRVCLLCLCCHLFHFWLCDYLDIFWFRPCCFSCLSIVVVNLKDMMTVLKYTMHKKYQRLTGTCIAHLVYK